MKYPRKELKTMARIQLSGNYGKYIGAMLLYFVAAMILNRIPNIIVDPISEEAVLTGNLTILFPYFFKTFGLSLIIGLISSVFTIGILKMYLDGARGHEVKVRDLFFGFRHHPDRVILVQFILTVIQLVLMAPGYGFAMYYAMVPDAPDSILYIGVVLLIIAFVPIFWLNLCFSQAMMLITDYVDIGPIQALKESYRLMKGNKWRLFLLQLSFMGLSLLACFSCGIAFLWLFPYMHMTYANFYRNITNEI